jgi:hypothetical protein
MAYSDLFFPPGRQFINLVPMQWPVRLARLCRSLPGHVKKLFAKQGNRCILASFFNLHAGQVAIYHNLAGRFCWQEF